MRFEKQRWRHSHILFCRKTSVGAPAAGSAQESCCLITGAACEQGLPLTALTPGWVRCVRLQNEGVSMAGPLHHASGKVGSSERPVCVHPVLVGSSSPAWFPFSWLSPPSHLSFFLCCLEAPSPDAKTTTALLRCFTSSHTASVGIPIINILLPVTSSDFCFSDWTLTDPLCKRKMSLFWSLLNLKGLWDSQIEVV